MRGTLALLVFGATILSCAKVPEPPEGKVTSQTNRGAVMKATPTEIWVAANDDLALTAGEVIELEKLAAKDPRAAMRLSNFHGFFRQDVREQKRWAEVAADLGDPAGAYSVGFIAFHSERRCLEAEKWMRLAAAGYAKAARPDNVKVCEQVLSEILAATRKGDCRP